MTAFKKPNLLVGRHITELGDFFSLFCSQSHRHLLKMFLMRQNFSVLPTFVDDPGVSPRSCKVTQPPPWLLSPLALKQEDFFYSV